MWKRLHTLAIALSAVATLAIVQLVVYTPTSAAIRRLMGGTTPSASSPRRRVPTTEMLEAGRPLRALRAPATNSSAAPRETEASTPAVPATVPVTTEAVPAPTAITAPESTPTSPQAREPASGPTTTTEVAAPATAPAAIQDPPAPATRRILPSTQTRQRRAIDPAVLQKIRAQFPVTLEELTTSPGIVTPEPESASAVVPAPTSAPTLIPEQEIPPVTTPAVTTTEVPAPAAAPVEQQAVSGDVPLPPADPLVRDRRSLPESMAIPQRRRALPERLDRILAPTDAEKVTGGLQVTLSDNDRQQAVKLRERVVPSAMFEAAPEATRAAVETFIAAGPGGVTGSDPCVQVGAGQRAALIEAFRMTQHRLPESTADYQFACALVTDPEHPIDVTKEFGDTHRNTEQETYALKNFVNFFGRPPSKAVDGDALAPDVADRDWWAVKYLTYHPVLAATVRNRTGERDCIRAFVDAEVDLYEQQDDGSFAKVKKAKGAAPTSLWQWDFIRACTYSGAPFVEEFTSRARKPQPAAPTQRRLLH